MLQRKFILLVLFVLAAAACAPRVNDPTELVTPTALSQRASQTLTPPPVAATPTGSANAPSAGQAHLNEPFVLHIGETAVLSDSPDQFGITFYNVKQDSRCPQGGNIVCVWAGEVRLNITFQENGIQHPPILELTTTPNDPRHIISVQDYSVELVQVNPPKFANVEIAPNEYAATFRVTRAPITPTPASNPTTGALDQPLTLKMFQKVEFPQAQMHITLNGMFEDSRCPKQVTCVQAGRAIVSFMLERNQRLGFFALSTQPPDGRRYAYFEGYEVELLDVAPYPDTVNQQIPATAYTATIVARKHLPVLAARKNEGFVLQVGQSATIEDEKVQVKFERVASDSRCAYGVMCAVQGNAQVHASLTLPDGSQQKFILNTDSGTPNQRIPDTGAYGMQLVALAPYPRADIAGQEIAPDEYEATFVVREFASQGPLPTKTPTTLSPTTCLGLTSADAEAILGEPVQPAPLPNVKIEANPFDDESRDISNGLCGYISSAPAAKDAAGAGVPRLSGTQSAAAVTADRLSGVKTLELVRIANLVRGANTGGDATPYLILKTRLAAGDLAGLFDTFRTLTTSPNVHFEAVDSFDDEGLWIWRDAGVNHYAALLVRDQNSFLVVEALTKPAMSESAVKEAIHAAMNKIIP